jgi:hypothetical protein
MRRAACALGLVPLSIGPALTSASGERLRLESERATVEYTSGALGATEASAFARLAEDGVADVEALVSPGLPAWARRSGRIRFVVSDDAPISRTYGRTVVLPIARVRDQRAPYLHETVHALVPARGDRTWLSEGLACYLESYVAEHRRGYDAHVFTRAGDRGIHAAARRVLESSAGKAVLPWVGATGSPPNLEEDRSGVARPFYVLSHSLAKHVVEAAGLAAVVRALVSSDPRAFAEETGQTGGVWQERWLKALGAGTPSAAGS